MKIASIIVGISISIIIGLVLLAGCEEPTPPPYTPVQLGLNIYLYLHPQEADPNENVYIGGRLNNSAGTALRGSRVYFTATPETGRQITPFGETNPDSATGFNSRVTFNGQTPGIYVITGQVYDGQSLVGKDTVSIRVRDPING